MMMRAGMVSATFKISMVLISELLMPSVLAIASIKGAWLNHITKLMKNASQVICRTLVFPEKANSLNFWDDIVLISSDEVISPEYADCMPMIQAGLTTDLLRCKLPTGV
jgi:hypothetical protein